MWLLVEDSDPSNSAAPNGVDALDSTLFRLLCDDTFSTEGVEGPSNEGDERDVFSSDIICIPIERDFLWCCIAGELTVLAARAETDLLCR